MGESGVAAEVDGDHAEIVDISGRSACPDDAELEKFVTDHEYSLVRFAVVGIIEASVLDAGSGRGEKARLCNQPAAFAPSADAIGTFGHGLALREKRRPANAKRLPDVGRRVWLSTTNRVVVGAQGKWRIVPIGAK